MRATLSILLAVSLFLPACSPSVRSAPDAVTGVEADSTYPIPDSSTSSPEAHVARGGELPAGALETLAACWFEKPYAYMFGHPREVTVGDGNYGMLQAGTRGILFYGHLNDCVGRMTGHQPRWYTDTSPFEALSGLPVAIQTELDGAPFTFFNRDIMVWGRDNLLPDPSMSVLGTPAQAIYDGVFSRFFRLMAETYALLNVQGTYQSHMATYMEIADDEEEDGIEWLHGRFSASLPSYGRYSDGTSLTPSMAIGFWLRRGIDGTSDDLWLGLREVMRRFDGDWYSELASKHYYQSLAW